MMEDIGWSSMIMREKEEYWNWFIWAVYIVITVDLLVTSMFAKVYGIQGEVNPLITLLYNTGLEYVLIANIVVVGFSTLCFLILLEAMDSTEGVLDSDGEFSMRSRKIHNKSVIFLLDIWLGLLVAGGLFVFANNLIVLFRGPSLVYMLMNLF